jgi:ribosomal protein S19
MRHAFHKVDIRSKTKINFFSYKVWRSIYLITLNPVHHTSEKKLRTRASVLPSTFLDTEVIVHSGKRWHTRRVNQWMIGYKLGEFTWNRRLALYKAKQLRKKSKKGKK